VQAVDEAARATLSLEDFVLWRDSARLMGTFAARAVQGGAMLLAGTDNGNLFDELEAYERAGIPRATILRAATINGALWLGRENDFGAIEPHRRADLIIVEGDPLTHISDLRRIRTVVKDGRVVFESGATLSAPVSPLP
jgi:imidazolonepropionase-like amidohydrolase